MAHRQVQGKDEASCRLGDDPGRAAELGEAMAFALANRGNRGIVGVNDLAMGQGLALGQSSRLTFDPVMRLERSRELGVQTRLLVRRQWRRTMQVFLGGPRQEQDWRSHL